MFENMESHRKHSFKSDRLTILEQIYLENPKPTSEEKTEIAQSLGLDVAKVKNWFQNRRAKERKIKERIKGASNSASTNIFVENETLPLIFPRCNSLFKKRPYIDD